MTKFNIGDLAYHAKSGQQEIWITCPAKEKETVDQ
jgi:hypothetical protein